MTRETADFVPSEAEAPPVNDVAGFDLDSLAPADAPTAFQPLHPSTGVPLTAGGEPVILEVIGSDHPKIRALDRLIQNKRLKAATARGRVTITAEEVEQETLDRLATAITGWTNLSLGGEPLAWSPSAARDLMKRLGWLRDQVDEFHRDRGNFLKAASAGS